MSEQMDNRYKRHLKKTIQLIRPYEEGESLDDVSVWDGDTPEIGGGIGINPKDESDQWYINKKFMEENYVEVI